MYILGNKYIINLMFKIIYLPIILYNNYKKLEYIKQRRIINSYKTEGQNSH